MKGRYEGIERFELHPGDDGYPTLLSLIRKPPKTLYGIGARPSDTMNIAVVGARKATPYGLHCASLFAQTISAAGFAIVSGGALGCDQAAHRAALSLGNPTVAVMGCGADMVYPANASDLLLDIARSGTVLSELPWGHPPTRWAFRERNRIIAGLSRVVLIVEAGMPSGTFSTADYALEAGRDVLVVPGSILSPQSKGSNRLLYQGATPVIDQETLQDALALMRTDPRSADSEFDGLEGDDPILNAIIAAPQSLEELCQAFQTSPEALMAHLVELEMNRLIIQLLDGSYVANPTHK